MIVLIAILLLTSAAGAEPPPLSDSSPPLTTHPPSPIESIVEGGLSFAERKESEISILRKYGEANLRTYGRPSEIVQIEEIRASFSPAARPTGGIPKAPDGARIAASISKEALMATILASLKGDAIQSQMAYQSTMLQGLSPIQWYLLAKEVPTQNTFSFHRGVQFLEELFRQPAIWKLVSPLEKGFASMDKSKIVKGYYDYRVNRLKKGQDEAAVKAAMSFCVAKSQRYVRFHGTSLKRVAQFFAILHDTLLVAKGYGETAAANQLFAIYGDLRLISLRLSRVIMGPAEPIAAGRPADDIQLAVREALIYGTRMFKNGFHPERAGKHPKSGMDGDECVRRLEVLQRRLFAVREVQRRVLRAIAESKKVREDHPELATYAKWLHSELRVRLDDLEKEVRVGVYGGHKGLPDPGSVEGLLFDPTLKAEVISLRSELPQGPFVSAGIISARNEVFRLLARIKMDHEGIILPFLHEIDLADAPEPGAKPKKRKEPTKKEAKARLELVRKMVKSGKTIEGALLTPKQTNALRREMGRLCLVAGVIRSHPSTKATTATTATTTTTTGMAVIPPAPTSAKLPPQSVKMP